MTNNSVLLYVQSSCSSSRKAKKWLEEQGIPHEVIHVNKQGVNKEHLKQMLIHTENGFEDVIKKTKITEEMEEMSFNELIDHLSNNPTLLKSPILLQGEDKVLIGYHEDEICVFLPRTRKHELLKQYHIAI